MSTPPKGQHDPGDADGPDALSFEQALEMVESIIERIETGEAGLEESIAEYERGVELIKRCRNVLKRAEHRVDELTERMLAENGDGADDARDDGAPPPGPIH